MPSLIQLLLLYLEYVMFCSSVVPSSSQIDRRPSRTRRETSGSSDAVGSSSTSSRGRCSVARTMPTSVRCPDDSSVPMASARCSTRNRAEPGCDRRRGIGEAVEVAVQREVLADVQVARRAAGSRPRSRPPPAAWLRSPTMGARRS